MYRLLQSVPKSCDQRWPWACVEGPGDTWGFCLLSRFSAEDPRSSEEGEAREGWTGSRWLPRAPRWEHFCKRVGIREGDRHCPGEGTSWAWVWTTHRVGGCVKHFLTPNVLFKSSNNLTWQLPPLSQFYRGRNGDLETQGSPRPCGQ